MSFNWDKDEVNVRTSRLLDTIVNLTNEDHVITPDEDTIIEATRSKLYQIESQFLKMKEDNVSLDLAGAGVKRIT
ncbi:MAG: hypothetical protein IH840_02305 [Candidatus Heimdallarchaeota archaeon]|nr:hypothetical protein [Candidatus Heimdallarchaeota archaeon]